MATQIQPYIFFGGKCEEALDFYSKALGAKVEICMKYKDSPEPPPPGMLPPGYENKVMHATFHIGDSTLMASDGCGEEGGLKGFSLAFNAKTEAEAQSAFKALSPGGEVKMPLTKTFWSPCFGMLTDKFGLGWMISTMP